MRWVTAILRDPLCHFLAAALVLFAVAEWKAPEEPPANETIVVDRERLLSFVQCRTKAFQPAAAAALLDAMSEPEKQLLVQDYVREEALYREAKAMGLAAEDYMTKRRLIQKLEFVADSAAQANIVLDDAGVRAFYQAHGADYAVAPTMTFTHVFFDADKRGMEQALSEARRTIARLNGEGRGFSDGGGYGDRFPFLRNYVDRTPGFVVAHLGEEATAALQKAPLGRWSGPVMSSYGAHAVFVKQRSEGYAPALDDIRERVTDGARREAVEKASRETLARIVGHYRLQIELGES